MSPALYLGRFGISDAIILAAPLLIGWILYEPLASWRQPGTLIVGADQPSGTTGQAFATVQAALDHAIPGDRIVIAPGTYFERIHVRRGGTVTNPVIISAASPGTVTISGADPRGVPAEWKWQDDGDGVYSTAISRPVYRLDNGEATCFRVPWGGLTALRELAAKPGAWSAFCTENDRLYVALRDGRHPAQASLKTHRPAPAPREWGEFKSAAVWIEADHVQLEGLRIEDGIGAAVAIWNAQDVDLRDCAFSGSTFGVRCVDGQIPPRNVRLTNCLYHNFPQYHWRRDWLTWNEVYAGYAASSLVTSAAAPLTIENCLVVHAGDALQVSPRYEPPAALAQIHNNYLAFCTDDAIEFDGDGFYVEVRSNLVYEAHQNLAFSPVEYGPIIVRENLFAHPPDGINGSQVKLITNQKGQQIQHVTVRDNVFVGNWLCWWSEASRAQNEFVNNWFFVRQQADPPWPPDGVEIGPQQVEISSTGDLPETTLKRWYHSANEPGWVRNMLEQRPGPSWCNAETHPATRDAMHWREQLREALFHSQFETAKAASP
ncbi:MAG TPA: right-handed parallel beta-helix repeat-containing protein [Planctomycetaceae bacterium]|nr:right-handed parallel beta-helix repeat-containing protein [Planctomycetaceae bacterium]